MNLSTTTLRKYVFIFVQFFLFLNFAKAETKNFSNEMPKAYLTNSEIVSPSFYASGSGTITRTANLTSFTACQGVTSSTQTITISASSLNASTTVNLLAPTGFEISGTSTGTYSSSLVFPQTSAGSLTTTTVFIRLSASAPAGTYSGSLSIASDGANTDLLLSMPSSTVTSLPTVTAGTIATVLSNATSFSIPLSTTTGTPDEYSVIAGSPALTSFVAASGTISGTSINVTLPASKTAGSYGFSLRVKKSTTGCESAASSITLAVAKIVTTGTISAFTTCIGTASASQSFSVTASDLTSNLVINAPAGFELATSLSGNYSSTVTLTQVSGSVTTTSIFVRVAASATASSSGSISISSSGASSELISISSVINSLPTIRIGSNSNLSGPIGNTNITGSGTAASSGTWSSSNTSVATIAGNGSTTGVVTGIRNGITKITYTNNNGCSISSLFRVGSGKVLWYVTNTEEVTPNVDVTFKSIPLAIDKAISGDTIIVYRGTYKDKIEYGSKNLILASRFLLDLDTTHISRTRIDGSGVSQNNDWNDGFIRQVNFTSDTSLQKFIGFTVINTQGLSMMFNGGVIRNNIFTNNVTREYDVSVIRAVGAKIENNIFDSNKGGHTLLTHPFNQGDHVWTFINNNIFKNQALVTNDGNAAIIHSSNQKLKIWNNLFHNNKAPNIISVGGFRGYYSDTQ